MSDAGQVRDFKDLRAWQCAMSLCEAVYPLAGRLPDSERYGLVNQIRRSAASIPANIAEGYGRGSRQDYARFVRQARGSACELETHLLLAQRLGMLSADEAGEVMRVVAEVRRLLHGLVLALED